MTRVLPILRYIVLIAIAALGVDGILDSFGPLEPVPKGQTGIWLCVAAVVGTAVIVWGILTGRLPLRTWYVLPFVVGAGAGFLANEFATGILSDLSGIFIGFAAGLVALPCFQLFADRLGPRDWYFVMVPFAAIGLLALVGLVMRLL